MLLLLLLLLLHVSVSLIFCWFVAWTILGMMWEEVIMKVEVSVCGQAQAVGRTERGHANDSEYHISKQLSLLVCSSIVITEYLWSKDVSMTWMNMWLEEKQTSLIVLMNLVTSWERVRECLSYLCRFLEQLRVSDLLHYFVCLSILICINVTFKCL